MPYKYIGRTTDFVGKSLWEILGNLKNYGVGRIVVRNKFQCYPEPTYIKILKVEALPNPKEPSLDNMRKVRVLVENTFRGKTFEKPVLIEGTSYKWDYRLIPKDEEQCFKTAKSLEPTPVLPRTMTLPPLLRELVIREAKARGEKDIEEPRIDIVYNRGSTKRKYRIAEAGEKPDKEFDIGLGVPISPNLYKGVKM